MTLTADVETIAVTGIVTTRYQDFSPDLGIPVRISIGAPRFWRFGPLVHSKAITPYDIFRNDELPTVQAQRIAYHARLDELAEEAVGDLAEVARAHPGDGPLVLLCDENVRDGGVCHRRWFAEWIADRYDIAAPEVDIAA
jgi:hypothetical protein